MNRYRPGRILANTALLAGSTLLALVVMELFVRILDVGPQIYPASYHTFQLSENPALGYELAPGAPDDDYVINRFGMRDRDYTMPKPRDVYRIAVVGDSIAYGWMLDRDDTLGSELERKLNRDTSIRYEVLNFGVTGYNATQIAENVRTNVIRFSPDVIVYAYCLNDPQAYSTEMARLLARVPGVERFLWADTPLAWLRRSRVAQLTVHGYRSIFPIEERPAQDVPWSNDPQFVALEAGSYADYYRGLHTEQGGWTRVRDAVQVMRNATSVPVVVVIFPLLKNLQDYPLEAVHRQMERELTAQGMVVHDLLPAFRRAEARGRKMRLDALHPTREGNALAARQLIDVFRQEGLPPMEPGANR